MAAPAELRTPTLHRAKRFAPRECGWKHGDSGYSAEETFSLRQRTKTHYEPRIPLTPTGLLMEGRYAQNPLNEASKLGHVCRSRLSSQHDFPGLVCLRYKRSRSARFPCGITTDPLSFDSTGAYLLHSEGRMAHGIIWWMVVGLIAGWAAG